MRWLVGVLFIIPLWMLYLASIQNKSKGNLEVKDESLTTGSTVRGIRNKNPLNIEYNKRNNWLGQQGTDGRFCIFSDNKYGFRAGARVLRSYQRRGINTIHSIVHTFAPDNENETDHYANMVSEWMGISKHAPIDVSNDHVAANIIKAMARMEVGQSYPIETVLEGVKLA
jgi:hypothetical protein